MTVEGKHRLPPGQQLAAPGKWPVVGERKPAPATGTWRLAVFGQVEQPLDLSLDELTALPRCLRFVDIHCVTRWSQLAVLFAGVALADVLRLARPRPDARYISFLAHSTRAHSTSLDLNDALALGTLLATECEGRPLDEEHGGPLRGVVPDRYFYKSIKWLRAIELLTVDRLGYWERQAGYHNGADPWQEQRFIASSITRRQAVEILQARNLAGRELLGLYARGLVLTGLNAAGAILRDADFCDCDLMDGVFRGANLSNARFRRARLRGADFTSADLEGTDFCGADLRGARLAGAALLAARFCDSDSGDDALLDQTTCIDAGALEQLMPVQQDFVRRVLASS